MPDLVREDGFVARGADLSDAPGILRVLASAFPAWPRVPIDVSPLEHLQWKLSPPGLPPRHHTVATFDDQIVAAKLRWIGRARLHDVEYMTDGAADLAVDADYQGRGLGRLMADYDETGDRPRGAIGMNLPSNNEIVRLYLGADGSVGRPLNAWTRPLRKRRFVSEHLRAGGVPALAGALRRALTSPRADEDAAGHDTTVVPLDHFDQRVDALWSAAQDQFQFSTIRDAAYLNWRHADRRAGRSTILGLIEAGDLRAYAVLRPSEYAINLVDLLYDPRHPHSATTLLQRVVAVCRERGAGAIGAWLPPDHPYEPALAAAGFVRSRTPLVNEFFAPRGSNSPPEVLEQLADPTLRAHVAMGDFDFV